ncbi:phage regulatory protein [Enterococcus faecalis]|uniref:Rha family transcriptional regulator n=1 Tax=Enterococcus faecalis TaxID=1351 RepID=UPI000CF049B6|nr:Rha family transcriptional regulator [Enterococcus faecalis]EHP1379814.1 ORF6C domain-containing protein [Enterococcus faecalis]EHR4740224.1 ORF6C domain-containing protein [Enterococcus faecalis]EJY7264959.1 ORF6C domain-containing protein [Enterococcus faecalis]EJZ9058281.1 ORF6C domain-containing protein [Enterococcus faecalis]EKK0951214.1 ORF6C domain-containing protein [Enterococcus faecalis]
MDNLVIMKDQQAVTSSLQIAETFNKNHRDVLAAIDDLKEGVAENYADLFYEDTYIHPQNKQSYRQVIMNRDGFTLLAMGFTGQKALQFKLKYIEAFNQMEKEIQQPKLPTSKRELAILALSANEETNERVDNIDKRLVDIEENKLISTEDKGTIDSRVRKKVYYLCKEQRLSQEAKSMLFQDLGSSIKRLFNVPNRGRIKDKDFQRVLEFIDNWQPSSVTKEQIKQLELEMF